MSFSELVAQYLNFAEFPVLKLICAMVLAYGTWWVLREVFDTRLANVPLWIKVVHFVLTTAFWYLIMTLMLGYSETAHALFARISQTIRLTINGILQLTTKKR